MTATERGVRDADLLAPAEVTRRARSNFSLSFAFLDRAQRAGMAAIYAYCRAVDDAVDDAEDRDEGLARLNFWRDELRLASEGDAGVDPRTEIGRALRTTLHTFGVSPGHLGAVADGCESDLRPEVSFADLPVLESYCEKVASAVGLACLPVFGVDEASCGRYADRLGKALQLTNILRDLRTDAEISRRYVPDDYCAATAVDPDWLDGTGPAEAYLDDGPVHRLVQALSKVARQRFDEAQAAMPTERRARRCLVTAEIMGAIYFRVLELVEARRGHIDRAPPIKVSKPRKIWIALRTWRRGGRLRSP